MNQNSFPGLFIVADSLAASKQKTYFRMLVGQYAALSIASGVTLLSIWISQDYLLYAYLTLLVAGLACALFLVLKTPNESWYEMRALAESSKTLTWRYTMRAAPFSDLSRDGSADIMFEESLLNLLSVHESKDEIIAGSKQAGAAITAEMRTLHAQDYDDRKQSYLINRIENQLSWYTSKAAANKRKSVVYAIFVVAMYVSAIGATVIQLKYSFISGQVFWLSEPLLVLAASLLGYAQAKRFGELSASYSLTKREIQRARKRLLTINDANAFSAFVNETETVFSREHTQWLARILVHDARSL